MWKKVWKKVWNNVWNKVRGDEGGTGTEIKGNQTLYSCQPCSGDRVGCLALLVEDGPRVNQYAAPTAAALASQQ